MGNLKMKLLLIVLLVGSAVAFSPDWFPKARRYYWSVGRDVQVLEGRTLIVNTINGRAKGPAIFAKQGDTLIVTVTNDLPDAGLSIHWHGMEMRGYQLYDGPIGLVQCAIAPGESITYTFKVQEGPGTYWYHTHNEMFPAGHDMVRGPIIVMDKDGAAHLDRIFRPYDYTMGMGGLRGIGGFDAENGIALTAPWSGGM